MKMDQKSVNATNRSLGLMPPLNSGRGVVIVSVTGKPKIPPSPHNGISNQGVATLIVMCCVLGIIIMFCCFAAPGIRDLCKKYVFRTCVIDDPEVNNVWNRRRALQADHKIISEKHQRRPSRSSNEHRQIAVNNAYNPQLTDNIILKKHLDLSIKQESPFSRDIDHKYKSLTYIVQTPEQSPTPTLILLPFGRMLVVDRSMFQALQSEPGGLDFLELSRQVIRNQSLFTESTPSILDCDSTSKGLTPDSLDISPPAYEDIFKKDLPPAYSELSLMFRTQRRFSECASTQNIEMSEIHERHLENYTDVMEM